MFLPRDRKTGVPQHTLPKVYCEMLLQICHEYSSLPDPRSLTLREIRFFYEPIRESLKQATKPK